MSDILPATNLTNTWTNEYSRMENVVFSTTIPAQSARTVPFPPDVNKILTQAIQSIGILSLYSHQAEVFQNVKQKFHQVITAGTSGGKSLAYSLPVLDALFSEPSATAFMVFPTIALAQNQWSSLNQVIQIVNQNVAPENRITHAIYDGDTPTSKRKSIRENCRLILTNPDMLHAGILPRNPQWSPFIAGLQFIVLDEIHIYRGVFGSHVANVIRRLKRICAHYHASPLFLMTSASIANPVEHASSLVGSPVIHVSSDGSAHGKKTFCIYNPPLSDPELGIRKSAVFEAITILRELVSKNTQTIVFGRARKTVEFFVYYFSSFFPEFTSQISAYRSGYLGSDRRVIEKRLRDNDLKAVISTNALELGIDIGSMDAALLIGYPGSIASTIQQIGRAGRKTNASLAILVATGNPTDQYLAHHPDYLLGLSPESALIDPNHLLILLDHIKCSLYECPFDSSEPYGDLTSEFIRPYLQVIADQGFAQWQANKIYWSSIDYPANQLSLRNTGAEQIQLILENGMEHQTIGVVDRPSSYWMVHPDAIYIHEGKTFRVDQLDLEQNTASLVEVTEDYYTEPQKEVQVEILSTLTSRSKPSRQDFYGNLNIHSQIKSFKRLRYFSNELLGTYPLDMPETTFPTTGCWFSISESVISDLRERGLWLNDQNEYGPDWKNIRERVLFRDQYRCRNCGASDSGRALHVHHVVPFKRFNSVIEANQLTNLVSLCPTCHRVAETNLRMRSGLAGIAYAIRHMAPLFILCDPTDLEVLSEGQPSGQEQNPSITIYDNIPGGIGLSRGVYDHLDEILKTCEQLISECSCTNGCPSCVGPAGENGYGGKAESLALLGSLLKDVTNG